jgi:hypothetical protein
VKRLCNLSSLIFINGLKVSRWWQPVRGVNYFNLKSIKIPWRFSHGLSIPLHWLHTRPSLKLQCFLSSLSLAQKFIASRPSFEKMRQLVSEEESH